MSCSVANSNRWVSGFPLLAIFARPLLLSAIVLALHGGASAADSQFQNKDDLQAARIEAARRTDTYAPQPKKSQHRDGSGVELGSVRSQEISQCRDGEIKTWGDGRDRPAGAALLRFTYNPEGSPAWFTADQAAGMVARAVAAWSQCGVDTEITPWKSGIERQPGMILVKWDEKESGGNFGQANFRLRTLSLGPKAFALLNKVNPAYDATETLQMVISHEMGHLFGLMAHSRRCVDVLSYYDNGRGEACYSRDPQWKTRLIEYRSTLPTACDIERCRRVNGKPPLTLQSQGK